MTENVIDVQEEPALTGKNIPGKHRNSVYSLFILPSATKKAQLALKEL